MLQLATASHLTKLHLCYVTVCRQQLSAALAVLQDLRHLALELDPPHYSEDDLQEDGPGLSAEQPSLLCGSTLQHLTGPTHLSIRGPADVAACNAYISCLTNLQHLELMKNFWSRGFVLSCAGWEHLQQQLTALSLGCHTMGTQHSSSLASLTS